MLEAGRRSHSRDASRGPRCRGAADWQSRPREQGAHGGGEITGTAAWRCCGGPPPSLRMAMFGERARQGTPDGGGHLCDGRPPAMGVSRRPIEAAPDRRRCRRSGGRMPATGRRDPTRSGAAARYVRREDEQVSTAWRPASEAAWRQLLNGFGLAVNSPRSGRSLHERVAEAREAAGRSGRFENGRTGQALRGGTRASPFVGDAELVPGSAADRPGRRTSASLAVR